MSFRVSREGRRTRIVFDDGGVNRLSRQALEELDRNLARIESDCRLLVLASGRDGIFAAGADMREMERFGSVEAGSFSELGQQVMDRLRKLGCPSVVIVDGDCHGGALDLVMAFDIRIATSRSRFAHPGARLGIVTGFGGTARIPRRLGPALGASLLLTGNIFDAEAALSAGLVHQVVARAGDPEIEQILSGAEEHAGQITLARALNQAAPALAEPQLQVLVRRLRELEQYR